MAKNFRSNSGIPIQDPISGSPTDLFDPNVIWSSGSAWRGVTCEAYGFNKQVETPEFRAVDHHLVLHLSPAIVDLNLDGRSDRRMRVPGDLSLFPAGEVVQVRSRAPHQVLVVALSHHVVAHSGGEPRTPYELTARVFFRDPQLEHICRALKAEAESNYVSGALYGESLALALGTHLLKRYSVAESDLSQRGGIRRQALRRVFDYIEANLDTPLQMAALAEIAGLSQYRFAHNFKSTVGLSPHQYVIHVRIEQGKRLLRETKLSILEIAYAVGCQSPSRFNALFRRQTGTTPSQYRSSFR